MSVALTPAASTRTSTSPAAGAGRGTARYSRWSAVSRVHDGHHPWFVPYEVEARRVKRGQTGDHAITVHALRGHDGLAATRQSLPRSRSSNPSRRSVRSVGMPSASQPRKA